MSAKKKIQGKPRRQRRRQNESGTIEKVETIRVHQLHRAFSKAEYLNLLGDNHNYIRSMLPFDAIICSSDNF